MSYMLEIPDELYVKLKKEADAQDTTLIDWIAAQLPGTGEEEHLELEAEQNQKTLADLFEGRLGRIQGNGQERLAEQHSELFMEYLKSKREAGHL